MAKSINRTACYKSNDISKKTVVAMFAIGTRTREWLDNLEDDQWEIINFIPEIKMVCAIVYTDHGTNHFSLTLP